MATVKLLSASEQDTSQSGMAIEGQVGVDRANGGRAFADRGRDSFGRSGADVADGEQRRLAGLERQRGASERFPTAVEVLGPEGQIGEHEPAIVEGDEARQPIRGGVGADEREQGGAGERFLATGPADPHSGQSLVTLERHDPGVSPDGDPLVGFDPIDELARHARREVRSPDHDGDSAPGSG